MVLEKIEERAFIGNFAHLYVDNNLTINQRNALDTALNIVYDIVNESKCIESALKEINKLIIDEGSERYPELIEQLEISNMVYKAFISTFGKYLV